MAKPEPAVRISGRRLIAENKVWNVYFADVRSDDHATADYLVVEPKHSIADSVTGVCVLPVLDGRIGLVRIFRVAMGDTYWEATKGFVDTGEQAADAALRELGEETGLSCDARDMVSLGSVTPEASTLKARVKLFAARNCRRVGAPMSEIGMGEVEFFDPADALAMAAESKIEDAATVTAIYRYSGLRQ